MSDLERFVAVCRGEQPDYVPIFGFSGAPGMSHWFFEVVHQSLVEQGMPEWVDDGSGARSEARSTETWRRYWGTTGPLYSDIVGHEPVQGFDIEKRIEGEWEIIEAETGAITRQILGSDSKYSMPHYIEYDVRDRKSWEFYRDRMTPGPRWSDEKIGAAAKKFDNRDKPLVVEAGGTWGGTLRMLMGPERACTILYDDPVLAHEILDWHSWVRRTYVFPIIERLRPEIISCGEDICYNHGMLISPAQFREFCSPAYTEIGQIARDCGVEMVAIDTDGNYMELVPLVETCGVNAIYPSEAKAGNDLFVIREQHPKFILMGWLEKECVNEGMGHLIEEQIMSKVPPLLARGRYFPNLEHALQPMVTFDNLCKFMTLLHEVTGNPEGEFPRIWP